MIEHLTRRDFEGLAAGELCIDYQGAQLPLVVNEVRDLGKGSPRQEPFAIVLGGPAAPVMPQGIYSIRHPVHGPLSLFIVPIERNAQSVHYEIVFN